MCQRCFSLHFDPPHDPPPIPPTPRPRCTKPLPHPSGGRLLLVWPRLSEHFDKVLGVGDKHPPPRQVDRVCRSQFAPSGGQLTPRPQGRRTAGRIKEATEITTGASLPFREHNRKSWLSTARAGTPKNSLPPGSKNIIYISLLLLFICWQTFSGSAGTRFR